MFLEVSLPQATHATTAHAQMLSNTLHMSNSLHMPSSMYEKTTTLHVSIL